MPAQRVLVATSDAAFRRAVAASFEEAGWQVLTTDAGADCVEKARAERPDLLVLLPPLLWGCVAGVLAVLHDDPDTRQVPVLVPAQPVDDGPAPRAAQPTLTAPTEGTDALPSLLDRARTGVWEFAPGAAGRHTP